MEAQVFAVGLEDGSLESGSFGVSSDIVITSAFKDTASCKGTIHSRRCTLRPGIVEYEVTLKNETILLKHPHWQNDQFLRPVRGVVFLGDITFNP